MTVMVSEIVYYGLILGIVLVPLLTLGIIFNIHKSVPWAWPMFRAFQKNMPIIFLHYPRGGLEIEVPKIEKDLKQGIPITYYYSTKWGIKFPDISTENTELLMGKLRVVNYFKNNVSPMSVIDVIALDKLRDFLIQKGLNITSREDVVLFFLTDYNRIRDVKLAIENVYIQDEDTKTLILKALVLIEENKVELENMKLKDGIFTYQTSMQALDRTIAFTGSAFSNAKSAIEAQMRAKMNEGKNAELYRMAIIIAILLVCAGIAYAIISKSGAL